MRQHFFKQTAGLLLAGTVFLGGCGAKNAEQFRKMIGTTGSHVVTTYDAFEVDRPYSEVAETLRKKTAECLDVNVKVICRNCIGNKDMGRQTWTPTFIWAGGFFAYEQALNRSPELVQVLVDGLEWYDAGSGQYEPLINEVRSDPRAARHRLWATLLALFFRSPQAILMVMLVGLIAPPLISRDVRSRAFLVYFSRPLTPREYVLGKASVVWAYLLMISGLPALALYIMAILLSPEMSLIGQTWDLPLRIAAASVVLLVPTTAVALCFSSLTSESRYAAFAWFAVWILGWVSYVAMSLNDVAAGRASPYGRQQATDRWILLSPYMTLGEVQEWVFGLRTSFADVMVEATAIVIVTAAAVAVLLRRVSAPMRI